MNLRESTKIERQLDRARALANATKEWFPVRVWRRVLAYNGLLLSAGISYQALFATFAALFLGILIFGVWFIGDPARLDALIKLINNYVPGLIGPAGAVTRQQLLELAQFNVTSLSISGIIAGGVLLWTASSWITYTRIAIRSVFGLPKDPRTYVWLKARDVIASLVFGALFIIDAALATISTNLFNDLVRVLGFEGMSTLTNAITRSGGLVLVFLLNTVVLTVMFFTLSGAVLRLRQLLGGATVGGLALTGLQVLSGFILRFGNSNPLLQTFVVFATLLLWFRLTAIVTLTAAAWVAEAQVGRGHPIKSRPRRASEQAEPAE